MTQAAPTSPRREEISCRPLPCSVARRNGQSGRDRRPPAPPVPRVSAPQRCWSMATMWPATRRAVQLRRTRLCARLTEATRQKVDAERKRWKRVRSLVVAPGVVLGLLPVGFCPACWPAYAGVLSTIGLGFLLSSRYLFPLTTLFLAFGVFALAFRARSRRGYGPFAFGTGGALLLLGSKFLLGSTLLAAVGIGLLVAASFWNSWPSRTARPCPKCTPSDAD